jgi:hypothetical protein
MPDTENDPLEPTADPPDNQGGTDDELEVDSSMSTARTADPPDNQSGGGG